MKLTGFTLIELLVVIVILVVLLAGAAPSFTQLIQNSRIKTAQYELLGAIEHARSLSVFNGHRSVIKAKTDWHEGWEIFLDKNDDGVAGADEPILVDHPRLPGVTIKTNSHVRELISFISTGEIKTPGTANTGTVMVGTLTLCPEAQGKGYKLLLSKGGRARVEESQAADCK